MTIQKNIREIILDTETTGLSFEQGDRIVDIGCIELINHVPTGKTYHVYLNPERLMSSESTEITGITDEFLADKPFFRDIVDEFLEFVQDSTLVIHNAKFDIDFLNGELQLVNKPILKLEEAIDTLDLARKKFPGSALSLNALCRRFNVDTSSRSVHVALIDCYLLADVYSNLLGGRQGGLSFEDDLAFTEKEIQVKNSKYYEIRTFSPSDQEKQAHNDFLQTLNNPKWNEFLEK